MRYATKEEIPGYREEFAEAFRRQQSARDLSFLDYPRTLCGEVIRLPNLRDIAALSFAGNAFVSGGQRNTAAALSVIWILSESHRVEAGGWLHRRSVAATRRRMFRRILRNYSTRHIILAVEDFIDDCFLDCGNPPGKGEKPPIPTASYPAYYVHFCMTKLHASEEWILSCPLPRLFQYLHQIHKSEDPGYTHNQPTDQVRRKYLAIFNAQPKEDQ